MGIYQNQIDAKNRVIVPAKFREELGMQCVLTRGLDECLILYPMATWQEQQKQLYSTIENYWLNATTSHQQYIYAKANVKSMQESYDLVSEQFNLGLKNIVELTTGKNNLLQAQQQLLQTKYTALLNSAMLNFYAGENIKL